MNDKKTTSRWIPICCWATVGAMMSLGQGCFESTCPENAKAGLPFVTCQPMDVSIRPNEKAQFKVQATGKDLTYQWFFIGGGETSEPRQIALATNAQFEIGSVASKDYGVYFCLVESPSGENDSLVWTHTRMAALGGLASDRPGGPFAPVQNPTVVNGTAAICGKDVGTKKVSFPAQTCSSPDQGFRGNLWKVVGTSTNLIPTNQFLLQWVYNVSSHGCCTNAVESTTHEVGAVLISNRAYKFYAFFHDGFEPPTGTTILLKGTWTR